MIRLLGSILLFLALLNLVALIDGQAGVLPFISDAVAASWTANKEFLNSNFSTSILGALAGAFFGAWGAQKISERSKRKDDLAKEIRNTNAAIALAFASTSTFIALMRQHVKPLKDRFDNKFIEYACLQTRIRVFRLPQQKPFELQFDFRSLTEVTPPLDTLKSQIFEKISLVGRPLILISVLQQSADGLVSCIRDRNSLLANYRARLARGNPELVYDYFGLPKPDGGTDQVYFDLLNAIYSQTEDGIFFSNLLAKDLIAHGDRIAAQYREEFGKGGPTINKPIYHQYALDLIPPDGQYADFVSGFTGSNPRISLG